MTDFNADIQQQREYYQSLNDNADLLLSASYGIKDHTTLFKLLLSGNSLINSHKHILSLENGVLTISCGKNKNTDIKRLDLKKWKIPSQQDLLNIERENALKKLSLREIELLRLYGIPFHPQDE